jgi:hypothetical protein
MVTSLCNLKLHPSDPVAESVSYLKVDFQRPFFGLMNIKWFEQYRYSGLYHLRCDQSYRVVPLKTLTNPACSTNTTTSSTGGRCTIVTDPDMVQSWAIMHQGLPKGEWVRQRAEAVLRGLPLVV